MSKDTLHIYTRVSTTAQAEDGTSLKSQSDTGKDYAKKKGYKAKVWNEGGKSSSREDLVNRPVLNELLDEVKKGKVKHLYVWNTDRLSRNLQTWGMIRLLLIQNDVHLHTPTGEQVLSDPQTNLMLGILSEFSQYDNQLRAERSRQGKLQKVRDGYWKGGETPYGYKQSPDKRLVPDKTEQKWVRLVYEEFAKGKSYKQISDILLSKGVLTRRKKVIWSEASIRLLLQNTHFSGYYYHHDKKTGEKIRIVCDTLIPKTIVKKARDALEKRSYKIVTQAGQRRERENQRNKYVFSGLLVCGECGARFNGNRRKNQNSYYMCSTRSNKTRTGKTCSSRTIPLEQTDRELLRSIVDIISNSSVLKEDFKRESLKEKSHKISGVKLKNIQRQIKLKKEDLDRVSNSIINQQVEKISGISNPKDIEKILVGLEKKRLEIEVDIEDLELEMKGSQAEQKWIDWVGRFKNKIESIRDDKVSVETKQEFLAGLVEKVTVVPMETRKEHKFNITFKKPVVGDSLTYKDPKTVSKGYTIKAGSIEDVVTFSTPKATRGAKKKH